VSVANEHEMTLDELAAIVSRGFDDLQGQIHGLRGEVTDLRGEVTDLRGQFTDLRGQFTDLRGEVTDLRGEVTGLRTELTGFRRDVYARFDRVERDLAEVKYHLADVVRRDEFLELKRRMDVVEQHVGLKPRDGG
jgi:predicted nuclease with TOPRIM domain